MARTDGNDERPRRAGPMTLVVGRRAGSMTLVVGRRGGSMTLVVGRRGGPMTLDARWHTGGNDERPRRAVAGAGR